MWIILFHVQQQGLGLLLAYSQATSTFSDQQWLHRFVAATTTCGLIPLGDRLWITDRRAHSRHWIDTEGHCNDR